MIKKIFTYSFGEVSVKGLSFLAIPLYSYLISPVEYGTLGFLNSLVSFLPFVFTFYYLYGYVRFSTEIDEKKLISTYFYLGLFINIFYFLSALVLYFLVIQKYNIALKYFIVSIASSSVIYTFQILQMYYRSKGLAKLYIRFSLLYSILGLGLNFILLLWLKDNIFAMLLSSLLTSVSASIVAYQILKAHIEWKLFDLILVKKIFRYTIPLVPGAIALLIFSQADKIILINYVTKNELGIYSLAFTLGLSMSYMGNAFFMSFQPLFYKKLSQGLNTEIEKQFWKNIVFILASLLLSFSAIYISYEFVNIKYKEGIKISFIIAISYSFITFAQMMELHLTYIKKTYLVSVVYGIGSIITLIVLFTLIPIYGSRGASFSLLISSFIISVFMYIIAQKNLSIAYNKFFLIFFYAFNVVVGLFII